MRRVSVVVFCILAVLISVLAEPAMAAKDIDVSGTSWVMQLKEKEKIKGVTKEKEQTWVIIHIGPNASQGIGADELKVRYPFEDEELVFNYEPDNKGRVEIVFGPCELEEGIRLDMEDVLTDYFDTVSDVSVGVLKHKVLLKLKPGKKGKFIVTLKFIVSATLDGEPTELTVMQKAKGKGVEIDQFI